MGVCYDDAESLFTKHNEFLVSFEVSDFAFLGIFSAKFSRLFLINACLA